MRNASYLLLIGILLFAGYLMLKADQRLGAPVRPALTAPDARTLSWRFTTKEATEDGLPPRTDVALITNGETYNLGGFPGSCAEIAPEDLLPNEVAGVLCWWAGAGDEVGVFLEEGRYVVRRGFQEEPSAESEGYRGSFNDVFVLD